MMMKDITDITDINHKKKTTIIEFHRFFFRFFFSPRPRRYWVQDDGSGHAIRYWPREERWLIDLDGLCLGRRQIRPDSAPFF